MTIDLPAGPMTNKEFEAIRRRVILAGFTGTFPSIALWPAEGLTEEELQEELADFMELTKEED